MKELTIQEKAEVYDEAIRKASIAYKDEDKHLKATLERIFPSLQESEDERIRKVLIGWINLEPSTSFNDTFDGFSKEQILAWLEKQCKKPVDKVEPKFKVGDWCIDNEDGTIFQIVKVLDNTYNYRTNEGKEYSCTHYSLELDARLWNMSDAKEGDVLVDSLGNVCIYQEPSTKLMYHSHCYGNHKYFICMVGSHEIIGSYPATKEQRDQLKKAMADAGYTFDFDKKELKDIEQKFNIGDEIKTANEESLTITKIDEKGYWSKDLFICGFDDAAKWELVEQKSAWSTEDTFKVQSICKHLDEVKKYYADITEVRECIDWLKSLEGRVLPKQKQEWSEEDEKRIAKYLYEKKGYPIDLNGNIPLFDETMKDVEKYLKYNNDQFIEKACTWLKDRAERFVVSTPVCYYDYKHAVEDFKTYMKGE